MDNKIIKGGFRQRNVPLSPDYRPLYKIGLITLILQYVCRGNKSSLNKLHFFIWAMKSEKNMAFIRMVFMTEDLSKVVSWGVEPALNKALNYAIAEGIILLDNNRYTLTSKGQLINKLIRADKSLLVREKIFLSYIGKQKVTEDFITTLTERISN
ncbi:MAG: hypothetical protein BGO09_04395 [Bacteroidetes bacterium 47-18]|nr:MAG: hypothetical protein BGO09_04395 [Bacteroidetes bacterium 47-18]